MLRELLVSALIATGISLALAGVGFYIAQVYYVRARTVVEHTDSGRGVVEGERQTTDKSFAHPPSAIDAERQGAIEAIEATKSLGNAKLVAETARVFGGPGARQALMNIEPGVHGEARAVVERALDDLFSEFGDSILRVDRQDGFVGTAFFVTAEGLALTAKHVVTFPTNDATKGASELYLVTRSGRRYPARLQRYSSDFDLALLAVDAGKVTFLRLASANDKPGETLAAMGYKPDFRLSVRTGTLERVEPGQVSLDLPTWPGMSGCPILNSFGEVVGILDGQREQASTTAIPAGAAASFLAGAGVVSAAQ
jgi:S1-C subfamily serine protease